MTYMSYIMPYNTINCRFLSKQGFHVFHIGNNTFNADTYFARLSSILKEIESRLSSILKEIESRLSSIFTERLNLT